MHTPWETASETQARCNYHLSSTRLLRRAGKEGSFWVRASNRKATGTGKSFTLWGLQVMVMVPGVQGQQLFRQALCSAQDHLSLSIGTKWPTRATWLAQPGWELTGLSWGFRQTILPAWCPRDKDCHLIIWSKFMNHKGMGWPYFQLGPLRLAASSFRRQRAAGLTFPFQSFNLNFLF